MAKDWGEGFLLAEIGERELGVKKKNHDQKISVVVVARDEAGLIGDCLRSVAWADEVIVIDTGSRDRTPQIAEKAGARVVKLKFKESDFAAWRNRGLKESKGDWIFYVDADERVPPLLKEEIWQVINKSALRISAEFTPDSEKAYLIPRRNFFFGREMHYGNTRPDHVKRLFRKKYLIGWKGDLHEEPIVKGEYGKLTQPLTHLTHRDLDSMMIKTIKWTKVEADLLLQARHPPVVWWRILRMMATKFWERIIRQQAWRDGTEGWLNALFEVYNTFIIYARLWEKQTQKPV